MTYSLGYFRDCLSPIVSVCSVQSKGVSVLWIHLTEQCYLGGRAAVTASSLWNNILPEILAPLFLVLFRKLLKTWLFSLTLGQNGWSGSFLLCMLSGLCITFQSARVLFYFYLKILIFIFICKLPKNLDVSKFGNSIKIVCSENISKQALFLFYCFILLLFFYPDEYISFLLY